ncbi:unnamed protein product [Arctogadus glacialis]
MAACGSGSMKLTAFQLLTERSLHAPAHGHRAHGKPKRRPRVRCVSDSGSGSQEMEDSALFCFGFLYLIAWGVLIRMRAPRLPHQDLIIPDQHLDWDGVELELELLVWDQQRDWDGADLDLLVVGDN